MSHISPFRARKTVPLSDVVQNGWTLKRYAILSDGRVFNHAITDAAAAEALVRLPAPGALQDSTKNHGIGFQIVHFAQTAVVSPIFYWQWGSVLARVPQMRAAWQTPTKFGDGVPEVVGCIWEMDIISFEVNAWKNSILSDDKTSEDQLQNYLSQYAG